MMDFNLETDIKIFDQFLANRPEVSVDGLKKDLERYYLPFAQKLIDLKQKKNDSTGTIIGVSAIQGAGKTTQGEILEILLDHFGHSTLSRSIDDHYITHSELCALREKDPRFIRRGVTHDIPLALEELKQLQNMNDGEKVLVSGYDKGAHHGDGDRFRWLEIIDGMEVKAQIIQKELVIDKKLQTAPALHLLTLTFQNQTVNMPDNMGSDIPVLDHELSRDLIEFLLQNPEITIKNINKDIIFQGRSEFKIPKKDLPKGWRLIIKKPDFIFYDGWMLGARRVFDESIFDNNLPALESEDDKQFAKTVNRKLDSYEELWSLFEFVNVLYVPNYQISLTWRDQAEEVLRAKGEGMTHLEITDFVHYFWRSVHPAIHIKALAHDNTHTSEVVIINDDHSIAEILTPDQVSVKYP